jgi:hypothetical protein
VVVLVVFAAVAAAAVAVVAVVVVVWVHGACVLWFAQVWSLLGYFRLAEKKGCVVNV